MSHRPTLGKQLAGLRKVINRQPLPVGFDLVDWLKAHGHAQTTGEADRLILAGRVRSGSHVIGTTELEVTSATGKPETQTVVMRVQPTRYKDQLIVLEES